MKKVLLALASAAFLLGCSADGVFTSANENPGSPPSGLRWASSNSGTNPSSSGTTNPSSSSGTTNPSSSSGSSGSGNYCLWYNECISNDDIEAGGISCIDFGGIVYPDYETCLANTTESVLCYTEYDAYCGSWAETEDECNADCDEDGNGCGIVVDSCEPYNNYLSKNASKKR